MKKRLLALTAIVVLALPALSFASYTGDASAYYNQHKAEYTLESSIGQISIGRIDIVDDRTIYIEENVVCIVNSDACYSASTAERVFGFDLEKFTAGYEKVTHNKANFINYYTRLEGNPHF